MPTKQQFYIGDCRDLFKTIESESINLIVTSPPYNIRKNYGVYKDDVALSEWKRLISEVMAEAQRVLKSNGSFCLNVSPVPDNKTGEIIPLESIAYDIAKQHGFYLRNMIVWTFNNMQNCTNRLSGRWESILWLVKDIKNYAFNLENIRVPYITQNDKRLIGGAGRNPTDVWYFDRVNNMTKNKLGISDAPCVYPIPMIERIIKMTTQSGDTVLDPFLGSGTTLVATKRLNRNGIGFELDVKYQSIIEQRVTEEGIVNEALSTV